MKTTSLLITKTLFLAACLGIGVVSFHWLEAVEDGRALETALRKSNRLLVEKNRQNAQLKSELEATRRYVAEWMGKP
jgi:hypothetical protein